MRLVHASARRYAGAGESFDDLVQAGSIGLIKAADRFDPSRGVAFSTFAAPAIDGEIRRHLRDRTPPLRIPRELQRRSGELRRQHRELTAALGRSPTAGELAKALGSDEREIQRLLAAERAREPILISSTQDHPVGLPEPGESVAPSDDKLLLAQGVQVLDEREQRIVFLRFHADMTERDIAKEIGISQAHVSRLLEGALAKLREALSGTTGPADGPKARTRIAPVGASPEDTKLARYLDLPYHLQVRREQEGGRSWWSATVEELPGCAARGSTSDEAVKRLRPAMRSWIETALAERREIPTPADGGDRPKATPSHSGRFLVRMPSTLHQQLAEAAERENVSLNRFVTDVLAASVANEPSVAKEPKPADTAPQAPVESSGSRGRAFRVALATNLAVVVLVGIVAVTLLVLALERGI
jgi:RNA polymerase sigma-B factor